MEAPIYSTEKQVSRWMHYQWAQTQTMTKTSQEILRKEKTIRRQSAL